MGKQIDNLISGNDGVAVYYVVKGEGRIRSMADEVKQSKATKAAGRHFGAAVRLSAVLREGLKPLLPKTKGRALINAFNQACYQWVHNPLGGPEVPASELPYLYQHQFNPRATLMMRFRVPLQVDWSEAGQALLHIPTIHPYDNIRAPAGTRQVRCTIAITGCISGEDWDGGRHMVAFDIPYTAAPFPAQRIELPYESGPGAVTVIAMALEYTLAPGKKLYGKKRRPWMPAGIIATKAG